MAGEHAAERRHYLPDGIFYVEGEELEGGGADRLRSKKLGQHLEKLKLATCGSSASDATSDESKWEKSSMMLVDKDGYKFLAEVRPEHQGGQYHSHRRLRKKLTLCSNFTRWRNNSRRSNISAWKIFHSRTSRMPSCARVVLASNWWRRMMMLRGDSTGAESTCHIFYSWVVPCPRRSFMTASWLLTWRFCRHGVENSLSSPPPPSHKEKVVCRYCCHGVKFIYPLGLSTCVVAPG